MAYQSVNRYFGMGKETTRGTAVAPSIWLPIDPNPTLEPDIKWLPDKSLRGSAVDQYDDVPSTRSDNFSFKGNVYLDTFPALIMALLGSTDTVTGTTAPYTHVIGLNTTPSTGSQPPSYTGVDVDNVAQTGGNAKQFTAAQLVELSIEFAADGALSYTSKFAANPFAYETKPSESFSTTVFVPAWTGAITLGGTKSTVVISGSLDIKRDTKPIFTVRDSQAPYRLWAGPAAVSGKFVFVAEATEANYGNALDRDHQVLKMKFTDPVSTDTVTFQMSAAQLKTPKVTSDKAWEEITANFVANANSTDAVDGGYAPIKTTTTNAQKTPY